jgi:hypothetical protein
MRRTKIEDLQENHKISEEEMKKVMGGVEPTTFPTNRTFYDISPVYGIQGNTVPLIGGSGFKQVKVPLTGTIQGITGVPGDFTG